MLLYDEFVIKAGNCVLGFRPDAVPGTVLLLKVNLHQDKGGRFYKMCKLA
jgi:hypothetical protein